jgi:hypothetical protein
MNLNKVRFRVLEFFKFDNLLGPVAKRQRGGLQNRYSWVQIPSGPQMRP